MVLTNKRNTSDFFLPHQQLPPVEQFLKSLKNNDDDFSIPTNLPELAFLRRLSIQGRLRYFTATSTSTEDVITITPPEGETFFIYRVEMSGGQVNLNTISLTNNGQIRFRIRLVSADSTNQHTMNIVDSLVGNGINSLILSNIGTGSLRVSLYGWIENTSQIRDVTT